MICLIFPMPLGVALQLTPVKLMDSLSSDGTVFFACQRGGDFFPCPAPLALFADEIHERFKAAVKGTPAARAFSFHRRIRIDAFQIHQRTV